MFCVNEYVMYGSEGVCMVESIGKPSIQGLDSSKEYYTLMPVHKSARIYTPTDSTILMRKVISKEKAIELLSRSNEISSELDVPKDAKPAMAFYKDLVRTYECEKLVTIIKYVLKKQQELFPLKKNLPAVDLKYMKIAEEMLFGELAFVLESTPKEIKNEFLNAQSAAE